MGGVEIMVFLSSTALGLISSLLGLALVAGGVRLFFMIPHITLHSLSPCSKVFLKFHFGNKTVYFFNFHFVNFFAN